MGTRKVLDEEKLQRQIDAYNSNTITLKGGAEVLGISPSLFRLYVNGYKPKKVHTDEEYMAFAKYYLDGSMSPKDIGKALNVLPQTVRERFAKLGVVKEKPAEYTPPNHIEEVAMANRGKAVKRAVTVNEVVSEKMDAFSEQTEKKVIEIATKVAEERAKKTVLPFAIGLAIIISIEIVAQLITLIGG